MKIEKEPREKIDTAAIHADRAALENELRLAGATINRNAVKCPFHEDRTASGSIHQGEDGAWRFRCHVCDITEDVIGVRARAAKKTSADVMREMRPAESVKPLRVFATVADLVKSVGGWKTVEDHYPYTNPTTAQVEMLVLRCVDSEGNKSFLQARPNPGGGFVMKAPPKPWPLFNRTRVAKEKRVVVVEGEKCVKAMGTVGVVATTSPGGADNAGKADWTPLAGKECVLWRDNDAAGLAYARDVAEILAKLDPPAVVRWIDVDGLGLPDKGDAADLLMRFLGEPGEKDLARDAVQTVLAGAVANGPAAKVRKLLEDTISGKRSAIPWPWPALGELTNALMPGMVTAICGSGGSTKTYMLIQAARYWHEIGVPFAFQALEEHEDGSHLLRALVQQSGNSDLLDLGWVKKHPDESREAHDDHEAFLESFGTHLWAVPGHLLTLDDLTDWTRDRAKDGARIVAIDPITAAEGSIKPWLDDKKFIRDGQTIMRDYGASLVLVTHPKKGAGTGKSGPLSMDDLAGGAAYQRHTQTVLWLNYFDEPKTVTCLKVLAGHPVERFSEINRSIKVFKATNGRGRGYEIGYTFGQGMLFTEHGVVVKAKADSEAA